jgi:hypothetical protein
MPMTPIETSWILQQEHEKAHIFWCQVPSKLKWNMALKTKSWWECWEVFRYLAPSQKSAVHFVETLNPTVSRFEYIWHRRHRVGIILEGCCSITYPQLLNFTLLWECHLLDQ